MSRTTYANSAEDLIVLSNRADYGILHQGTIGVEMSGDGDESLASAALRELRERGIDIRHDDIMFFPRAAPGHRQITVKDVCD